VSEFVRHNREVETLKAYFDALHWMNIQSDAWLRERAQPTLTYKTLLTTFSSADPGAVAGLGKTACESLTDPVFEEQDSSRRVLGAVR
jgi:hypothetical protein